MPRESGPPAPDRRALVANGAIDLLASEGIHGLTHRRLDKALGLPSGSTSNVFRRRIDLLRAALDALVAQEMVVVQDVLEDRDGEPADLSAAADLFADIVDAWLRPENRRLLLARYTLILESSRSDELAPLLATARFRFTALAESLCTAADIPVSTGVDRALSLVAWADGVLLAHITAGTRIPSRDDVHRGAERLLASP